MQIGLDLRFLKNNLYSDFIIELIQNLIIINIDNEYIIYLNTHNYQKIITNKLKTVNNYQCKLIEIKNFSIKEQIHFLKILKNDKNDLMIFFNHFKPIFYRGDYYTFILNLKDIYYWIFDSSLNKYKYLYLLEKNLQKSQKIICFDENTKNELIERFNIKETTINLIHWFFKKINNDLIENKLEINIKTKYSIKNDYLIYSCWDWIEKNIEKLIQIYNKIDEKIDLIIMWEKISKNIFLRSKINNMWLQNRIKFITPDKEIEKKLIYKQAIWIIFPSLYETFPFCLSDAINYNIPMIISKLKSLNNIFWNKVEYFSPISKSDMINKINIFIQNKNIKTEYTKIKNNTSVEKTTQELINIIN